MTFTDVVNEVLDRLNLTSANATTRVGRSINEAYKTIASTIGVQTIERVNGITANTVIGSRNITFTCEKILTVYNTNFTPYLVLDERTEDEMRNETLVTDPATEYAVKLMGASTVTLELNSAASSIYTLTADAMVNLGTLSGVQVPAFSEDFHNMLVYKSMQIELEKMEKYDKAEKQEQKYEKRLAEYRLYIAVSAYKILVQGKTSIDRPAVPMV